MKPRAPASTLLWVLVMTLVGGCRAPRPSPTPLAASPAQAAPSDHALDFRGLSLLPAGWTASQIHTDIHHLVGFLRPGAEGAPLMINCLESMTPAEASRWVARAFQAGQVAEGLPPGIEARTLEEESGHTAVGLSLGRIAVMVRAPPGRADALTALVRHLVASATRETPGAPRREALPPAAVTDATPAMPVVSVPDGDDGSPTLPRAPSLVEVDWHSPLDPPNLPTSPSPRRDPAPAYHAAPLDAPPRYVPFHPEPPPAMAMGPATAAMAARMVSEGRDRLSRAFVREAYELFLRAEQLGSEDGRVHREYLEGTFPDAFLPPPEATYEPVQVAAAPPVSSPGGLESEGELPEHAAVAASAPPDDPRPLAPLGNRDPSPAVPTRAVAPAPLPPTAPAREPHRLGPESSNDPVVVAARAALARHEYRVAYDLFCEAETRGLTAGTIGRQDVARALHRRSFELTERAWLGDDSGASERLELLLHEYPEVFGVDARPAPTPDPGLARDPPQRLLARTRPRARPLDAMPPLPRFPEEPDPSRFWWGLLLGLVGLGTILHANRPAQPDPWPKTEY